MYYINIIIFSILLTSCATTSNVDTNTSSGLSTAIQSEDEVNRYQTAIMLLNNQNIEEAKKLFLKFTEERPELAGPYVNLAIIAIQDKNSEEAFKLVNLALNKNPNLAQALNLLAFLEQQEGKIQQAEKHYQDAIKNKDDYAIAHYNIALLYDIYLQDIDKAIVHYERYMKLINNKDKRTADWLEQLKSSKESG